MSKKRLFSFVAAALFFIVAIWMIFDAQIDRAMFRSILNSSEGKYITYGTNRGRIPYEQVAGKGLIIELVCALPALALAAIFLIKGWAEEDKIPVWAFYIVLGANILFPIVFNSEHILWDRSLHEGISRYGSIYVSITVIIFLLLKKKVKKVFFLPCLWYGLYIICAIADVMNMNKEMIGYIQPVSPGETLLIIATLLAEGAAWFFALWVLIKENIIAEAPKKAAVAQSVTETVPAANETAADAPKLTQAQKEELDNAKELFELGAYSEEEYKAEVERITLGL